MKERGGDKLASKKIPPIYYIPLGVVTGNCILSNFGPKVPVKMSVIGNVDSDLKTKLEDSGINNVYYGLCEHPVCHPSLLQGH